jgi:formate dehydrogenase subunit delta
MSPEKLTYMANQIGKFFAGQGEDKAVPLIADHLVKFWDPRMRKALRGHAETGGAGLQPTVLKAILGLPPETVS